jgi:hypothetical protein
MYYSRIHLLLQQIESTYYNILKIWVIVINLHKLMQSIIFRLLDDILMSSWS